MRRGRRLAFGLSASLAQQSDSPLKSAMKILGFATDVAPPADFVLQSRPKGDLDFIPIFQPPPEPARPALNDKELKAVKGDLDSVAEAGRRASAGLSAGRQGGGRGGRGQEGEDEACCRPISRRRFARRGPRDANRTVTARTAREARVSPKDIRNR